MENSSDLFFFLQHGQHCLVDSIHVSVRVLQYAPADEILVSELYVFENRIYHRQIAYLVCMLRNDLKHNFLDHNKYIIEVVAQMIKETDSQ